MTAPRGKHVFLRGQRQYPGNDPVAWATKIGAVGAAVSPMIHDQGIIANAWRTLSRVYAYAGPSLFVPDKWEATLAELERTAGTYRLKGVIIDAEQHWTGREDAARAMAERMRDLRRTEKLKVGFTSFPLWPHWSIVAPAADFLLPQLEHTDAETYWDWSASDKNAWLDNFARKHSRGKTSPVFGAFASRTPEIQRAYLAGFAPWDSGWLWHGGNVPKHTELTAELGDWRPWNPPDRESNGGLMMAVILGLALGAGAALV